MDFVVLFGSAATGNTHPLSDVDIGVQVSNSLEKLHETFRDLLSLFDTIDSQDLPKIDVTLLNLADLTVLFRVVRDGKILYTKNEDIWLCFVEHVLSRYPDWHYYIEGYLKQTLGV